MQTTSATWKALWASGNARVETKAVINGTDYTEISDPIINRALMQNGCSIGNAVSATCQFAVRTNASIPKSAEVIIKYRLNDGTTASEWLNAGTFYISHRQRDPVTGVLSLECYDALLKANARMPKLMPWTTEGGVPITTAGGEIITLSAHYPRSMASVIHDLAILLGDAIRIDPSTTVETGDAYVITEEDISGAATINQILCRIAAANGGNWIMTPDNYLKLVPLKSAEGAASASSDVVDVVAVTGSIDTGNTGTITGIRYSVDNDEVVAGDETGIVIDANVSAAVAADLQTKLVGMTYQAYGLKSAIYDPATELGDYVRAGANGEIRAVLCAEVATLGLAYRGDMSAPEIGELADEYPYISLDKDLTKYVDESVAYLDNSLTQQEIFDRLTDGGLEQGLALEQALTEGPSAAGEKKIYLNLDYARFGKLVADFIQGGTLTLGGLGNVNGVLLLLDASGNAVGTLDNTGVDFTNGSFETYSSDRLKRAQLQAGQLSLQYYGMHPDSGADMWLDGVYLSSNSTKASLVTTWTPLFLYGNNEVRIYTNEGVVSRSEAEIDAAPGSIVLSIVDGGTSHAKITIDTNGIKLENDSVSATLNSLGLNVTGAYMTGSYYGATGSFTSANGKTVTVTNGIITGIV